jgi:hypothetical protein
MCVEPIRRMDFARAPPRHQRVFQLFGCMTIASMKPLDRLGGERVTKKAGAFAPA